MQSLINDLTPLLITCFAGAVVLVLFVAVAIVLPGAKADWKTGRPKDGSEG